MFQRFSDAVFHENHRFFLSCLDGCIMFRALCVSQLILVFVGAGAVTLTTVFVKIFLITLCL